MAVLATAVRLAQPVRTWLRSWSGAFVRCDTTTIWPGRWEWRRPLAGHSHAANIWQKKAREDARRSKTFMRVTAAIVAAVRSGGGVADPTANARLATALEMARSVSMPKDRVERALKTAMSGRSASGRADDADCELEWVLYGGYVHAHPLLIECLTDNRRRTGPRVQTVIRKHGGVLADSNAVQWQFHRLGVVVLRFPGAVPPAWLERCIDTGLVDDLAVDVQSDDDDSALLELRCAPQTLAQLERTVQHWRATEASAPELVTAELTWRFNGATGASTATPAEPIQNLVQALEDDDDVHRVYTA
ncbi:hypothetical protein CDCA_CDCA09G2806 [Cyanidium caldarium]|uniref:Uncharacterized protein n=1 Tax=Cyanidium caldarium TaxID=2771 RepID=A0AAV9IXA2_CYACA|nr:hypothetical protein CDCA_CDCA09G2806 [Cyanidium caldarium]